MLWNYIEYPKKQVQVRLGQVLAKKIVSSNNHRQKLWHKLKKYSKIRQDFNIISNFAFFWHLLSMFNFYKKDWALGYVSTHLWHFFNISSIFKIISLKSFGKSWGNLCTKFVMPDIKYHFTCADSDLSEIMKKLKNYDEDCLKVPFSGLIFKWWFNFLEKSPILGENR